MLVFEARIFTFLLLNHTHPACQAQMEAVSIIPHFFLTGFRNQSAKVIRKQPRQVAQINVEEEQNQVRVVKKTDRTKAIRVKRCSSSSLISNGRRFCIRRNKTRRFPSVAEITEWRCVSVRLKQRQRKMWLVDLHVTGAFRSMSSLLWLVVLFLSYRYEVNSQDWGNLAR